jgi:hypothetical protein
MVKKSRAGSMTSRSRKALTRRITGTVWPVDISAV